MYSGTLTPSLGLGGLAAEAALGQSRRCPGFANPIKGLSASGALGTLALQALATPHSPYKVSMSPNTYDFPRKRSLKTQLDVIFKGEVQGVGFRATCRRIAHRLGLTGFARNLPSGDVELLAQGEKASLEAMLRELKSNFSITEQEENFSAPTKIYEDFSVG